MDIIESNKEIAKMLGWIDADGDLVVPNHLSNGYNYSEWADTKYIKRDDLYKGCTICHYINVTQEGFSSDWNWLHEVVEKIESLKEGEEVEHNWYVTVGEGNYCRIFTDEFKTFQDEIIVENANTKREAVIQAVWEFLNYFYQKK